MNCIGFIGNYNGVVCDGFYWWDVKCYWKNAQNTLQKEFCNGLLVKANGL